MKRISWIVRGLGRIADWMLNIWTGMSVMDCVTPSAERPAAHKTPHRPLSWRIGPSLTVPS